MNIIVYDCEVFAYDWIVVFKDISTGIFTVIHNDNDAVREAIDEDNVYVGFNSKHFDSFIIKAIAYDFSPPEIKQLNDYLISGGRGWEYAPLQEGYFKFNNVDIRDDVQKGLSLKAIEAHLGMDIRESEVDFNIDRPLTEKELEETIFYCKHDVDATEQLYYLRKGYIENKLMLGRIKGIPDNRALYMTNAKLTAAYLDAVPKEHDDEREYQYPPKLLRQYIPQEVFDFFERLKDKSIPDEVVFKEKLDLMVGGCPCTIAYGGIHGAIPCYREEGDK